MTVIEQSHQFLIEQFKGAYTDQLRDTNCSSRLNNVLGFPKSNAKFEYYDVVLSSNLKLTSHIDSKNDHRPDFNHCVIYSFFAILDKVEYKVSIVMTSRYTIGAPIDKLR